MRPSKPTNSIFARPAKAFRRFLGKRSSSSGLPDQCHDEEHEPGNALETSRETSGLPHYSEYAELCKNPFRDDDDDDDDDGKSFESDGATVVAESAEHGYSPDDDGQAFVLDGSTKAVETSESIYSQDDDDNDEEEEEAVPASSSSAMVSEKGKSIVGHTRRQHEDTATEARPTKQDDWKLAFNSGPNEYVLAFQHAKQVMDRHILGPLEGLPLAAIETTKTRTYADGFVVTQQWRARIIAGELFLAARYEMYDQGRPGSDIQAMIERHDRRICAHTRVSCADGTTCTTRRPERATVTLPSPRGPARQDPAPETGGPHKRSMRETRACLFCFTDYRVQVQTQARTLTTTPSKNATQVVVVNSWHRLGPCRHQAHLVWQRFLASAAATRRARAALWDVHLDDPFPGHGAGCVRARYEDAEAREERGKEGWRYGGAGGDAVLASVDAAAAVRGVTEFC